MRPKILLLYSEILIKGSGEARPPQGQKNATRPNLKPYSSKVTTHAIYYTYDVSDLKQVMSTLRQYL